MIKLLKASRYHELIIKPLLKEQATDEPLVEAATSEFADKLDELNKKLWNDYADWLHALFDRNNEYGRIKVNGWNVDNCSIAHSYRDATVTCKLSSGGKVLNATMFKQNKGKLALPPAKTMSQYKKVIVEGYTELG